MKTGKDTEKICVLFMRGVRWWRGIGDQRAFPQLRDHQLHRLNPPLPIACGSAARLPNIHDSDSIPEACRGDKWDLLPLAGFRVVCCRDTRIYHKISGSTGGGLTPHKAYRKIKPLMAREKEGTGTGKVLMATVKGDIHEIGKNIVITLDGPVEIRKLKPIGMLKAGEETSVTVELAPQESSATEK